MPEQWAINQRKMEALRAGRPRERPHALTVGGRAGEAMPSKAAGDQVSFITAAHRGPSLRSMR